MKNVQILLLAGLISISAHSTPWAAQSANQEQALTAQMKKEIDDLSERFIKSLQAAGNLRKVDSKLLHPLFNNSPCTLVPFVEQNICLKLNPDERREYTMATYNIAWLMSQFMLTIPLTDLTKKMNGNLDEIFDELGPAEARPFMKKLAGRARSLPAFKDMYGASIEAEKILLEAYPKINDEEKRTIQHNYDALAVALQKDTPTLTHFEGLPEAFEYYKKPYRFVVAKDGGEFKVIQITPTTI
jgi:hypothetical protein